MGNPAATTPQMFSTEQLEVIRAQFPILSRRVREDKPLTYLDSGATSHKPLAVLDAERDFYVQHNSAPHRGAHALSEEATEAYELARAQVAGFIGAKPEEIVFTKNATEALNLIAYGYQNATVESPSSPLALTAGDEVLITEMEHHANLVPWQQLCQRTGATLRWIPITDEGRLDLTDIDALINPATKVLALTYVSNVLGTINPIAELTRRAHQVGARVILDACQAVPHLPIDAAALGVDALAFSGHKMYGPLGVGVLWAKAEFLEQLPPFITGGSMIELVAMDGSTFAAPPTRFEAGVPMTAQAVGLGAATGWMSELGVPAIGSHELALAARLLDAFEQRPWVRVVGPTDLSDRSSTVAWVVDNGSESVHPHDVGQILDDAGVAVRVGHHCAWPLHRALKVPASVRASFAAYNQPEDVDALVAALDSVPRVFGLKV